MARPKKTILKRRTITVHCTNTEYTLIKRKANQGRISMSLFLLNSGLGRKVESKLSDDEISLFRSLVGMANNLNQVAQKLHQNQMLRSKSLSDLDTITELLKRFE